MISKICEIIQLLRTALVWDITLRAVAYRGEGFGEGSNTPSEIPKTLQNRAKLNPIVKSVKIA